MDGTLMNTETRSSSAPLRMNILAALMFALAIALTASVTHFIIAQPRSALRWILLYPGYIYETWWLVPPIAIVVFVIIRRSTKAYLTWGVGAYLFSLFYWFIIQVPPLSRLLLPEIQGK